MNRIKAAIVCDDTLRALGLAHLLESRFDAEAIIVRSIGGEPPHDADIYFITPADLVKLHRFFMPRMRRTVVLTGEPIHSPVLTLNTMLPCDQIVEALGPVMASIPDKSHTTPPLSARETDVLRLISRGHINKEIADVLGISLNTVLTHRKNIIAKLGIKSPSGLAVYAMINGLL